jgi:ferredoxin
VTGESVMPGLNHSPRIDVDRDLCQGIGICESIAPEHFEVRDDGAMRVTKASVDPASLELVRDAVESCPTQALRLTGE